MIIFLIDGLIKNILLNKLSYFPEPYAHSKSKINVELDLSNHATKSDLKKQQVLIHRFLLNRLI